ncbi:MAG: phage portal protein, partial [bacterium]
MTIYKRRKKITTNESIPQAKIETNKELLLRQLRVLSSTLMDRGNLAGLGESYYPSTGGNANRDLYKTLGYIRTPGFDTYNSRYVRGDIAKRIIDAFPNATWRKKPIVSEMQEEPTEFDDAWKNFVREKRVFHYLARVDRISGIGQYGVLYMGYDGNTPLNEPIEKASELLYMQPCNQANASISSFVTDKNNPRYGLPEIYNLKVRDASKQNSSSTVSVHHSRVIHVAEGLNDDDVFGTPRLQAILNRLQDIDLIAGGSAEMFWRGAFPGYAIIADEGADLSKQDMDDLEDEIQNYMHNLERYMRLVGAKVQGLDMQVADPTNHFDIQIRLVSAETGIPKRILLGSERGELASEQDERAWNERVDERRRDHAELMILRPFIDKQIEIGVLPKPIEGYNVEWPDISVPSAKETAEVMRLKTEALSKYAMSP